MKAFLDEDFLSSSDMAKILYHDFAANMPILDYHCHINPQETYEDWKFDTTTQVWLGGGHYKWHQMYSNGIDEEYVTRDSTNWEKFKTWAETMPKLISNPLYHWSHLEFRRYFGYEGYLNGNTAKGVWDLCNAKLQKSSMTVHSLIKQSHVTLVCIIDGPVDSLEWYKKIAEDPSFDVQAPPAWRPDKAMNVEKPTFLAYMARLSEMSGIQVTDFASLKEALQVRVDFFTFMGCCVSDHTLEYVMYVPSTEAEVDAILAKGLRSEAVSKEEELKFKAAFMLFAAREHNRIGWIIQIHYGCKRDNNAYMFKQLGPDTGSGCINNYAPSAQTADFLNTLNTGNEIPKTTPYLLNPNDNVSIGTIIGCFQDKFPGRIQHGSAWWFNDHKVGMTEQMISLANQGCLGNFIGMLTDSRSFLSYTGREYFRRVLCELLGGWVENGEYPADMKVLEEIVRGICYNNAVNYFGFELDIAK